MGVDVEHPVMYKAARMSVAVRNLFIIGITRVKVCS
jgi:hypothetical protein